jgi:hypothetical protein
MRLSPEDYLAMHCCCCYCCCQLLALMLLLTLLLPVCAGTSAQSLPAWPLRSMFRV